MNESFHIRRAIAELEVAGAILEARGDTDPRIHDAAHALKAREIEQVKAAGREANFWSETDAATLRRDAKRAARRATKEKEL